MEMFGKKIETNEQKESTKGDVMQKILENKCVQNPIFQEKLRSAKQYTIFVEPSSTTSRDRGLTEMEPKTPNQITGHALMP